MNGHNKLECFVPGKPFQPSVLQHGSLLGLLRGCEKMNKYVISFDLLQVFLSYDLFHNFQNRKTFVSLCCQLLPITSLFNTISDSAVRPLSL